MEVRLRPKALKDIREILEYIALDNPTAAHKLVDKIEHFCLETLAEQPHIAPLQPDILEGIRIFPITGYRVCYFVREDHVDIVRILHHARDLRRLKTEGL